MRYAGMTCMLFVTLAFAVTSALAVSVPAGNDDHTSSSDHGLGSLEQDVNDESSEDFEDLFQQRLSQVELRSFAAPAALRAVNPCGLRGRMADGRREKPPRA